MKNLMILLKGTILKSKMRRGKILNSQKF